MLKNEAQDSRLREVSQQKHEIEVDLEERRV